ncbi:MAG TPA: hypothetical protein VGE52_04240 [Pirellulales bacterium]
MDFLFLLLWLASLHERDQSPADAWRIRLALCGLIAVPVVVLLGAGAGLYWLAQRLF